MTMRIRRASTADAAALAEVGTATFLETFGHLYRPDDLQHFLETSRSPEAFARLLHDPAYGVFVAQEDGIEIGYAVVGPCKLPIEALESAAGEVQQLYFRKTHQGGGRGARLLETALKWLISWRHTPLYIGVWSQNSGAQRFYARFGFAKVGEYDFPVGKQLDREFILRRD